ncbi:MAG TPA: TldD/PmbA family protein [Dehalococcoidia bacterium]
MTAQAEAVLELARRRAEEAEVFSVTVEETPVKFEANRLKSLETRITSGLALRVIKDGRIGFATSTRPDDAQALVDLALELAPFGAPAKFQMPGPGAYAEVPVFDEAAAAFPAERMVAFGQEVIDRLRRHTPELQVEGTVRKAVQTVRILNSAGADVSYRKTSYSANMEGVLIRGTDMLFVGEGEASCRPLTDPAFITESTIQQLEWGREIAKGPSGELPVIFTPSGVASALVAPLSMAFSGRVVWQGASPLGESLGQEVYDRRLSLWDDPTVPYMPGSRAVDDEGVPARKVTLVAEGVATEFLYDLQTAGLAGKASTGSAHRALTTQPSIGLSALVVSEGDATFADMLREIREGVVVEYLMGAGQGNVMGGEFSGNVLLGYKVERGEIVGRVKNTMVAGNVHQALKEIAALGSESRWVGAGLRTPPIAFARLSVSSGD